MRNLFFVLVLLILDLVELNLIISKLKSSSKELSELKVKQQLNSSLLVSQEKNVRKLETVPCGDQFPDCKFIKDSHEDKKLIEILNKCVGYYSLSSCSLLGSDFFMHLLVSPSKSLSYPLIHS